MNDLTSSPGNLDRAYERIRSILAEARSRAYQAINSTMVVAYWEIGRTIVEEEQQGQRRAGYGKQIIESLSQRLAADFGRGFDRTNLWHMRSFYRAYPILDALRRELSWTHYRILLRVEKPDARSFYENEAVAARWSTRELKRQVDSLLFERLALSTDREGVLALAQKGHEITQPADLVKDPYVLEFAGLPPGHKIQESDLEQALLDKSDDLIELDTQQKYRELTVRLWGRGVVLRRVVTGAEIDHPRTMASADKRQKKLIRESIERVQRVFTTKLDSL